MCGRYTLKSPAERIARAVELEADQVSRAELASRDANVDANVDTKFALTPRYNIAPTQPVPAVRVLDGPEIGMLRWGLIPYWAKDPAIGNKLINARAETVASKPAYRDAFRLRRCAMLADGFFEWQRAGTIRQPFYARFRDERPFVFAGLWERWRGENGKTTESCALITTEPNDLMRPVHDRMPVILDAEAQRVWLDPKAGAPALASVLRPFPPDEMVVYPVSRWVNDPRHDDPRCIEPA